MMTVSIDLFSQNKKAHTKKHLYNLYSEFIFPECSTTMPIFENIIKESVDTK